MNEMKISMAPNSSEDRDQRRNQSLSFQRIVEINKHCRHQGAGVAAQVNPPLNYTRVYSGLYPGMIWNIPWGIVWELPDYTPGYILGAPRVYSTCSDYTPSNSGWGRLYSVR